MSHSLLKLLQEFSVRRGLPSPQVGVASQDDQVMQLVGLLNEVLEDLTTRYVGTALQKTAAWEMLPQESQGELTSLCPYGFKWIINETFWDRNNNQKVAGPVGPSEWQAVKAGNGAARSLYYRVVGGELLLGGRSNGARLALEYASDWAVKSAEGTFKSTFTADSDTCIFPDSVLLAGLNWKWRLEKGLKYAEAFRSYEVAVTEFSGHDGSKARLSMDGGCESIQPGIFVHAGNWNLR